MGVSFHHNPPITQRYTNGSTRCSSVVERPLCIQQIAEGLGFDHLPLQFFSFSAVGARPLEDYNLDVQLYTMATSTEMAGWSSQMLEFKSVYGKQPPTSTVPCSVRHRLRNARGDSHRKKTTACCSLFGFRVPGWRYPRCALWLRMRVLVRCVDYFFYDYFSFADDGCADGCYTRCHCTCDCRANDWCDHDFFTSCSQDRNKVGMIIDQASAAYWLIQNVASRKLQADLKLAQATGKELWGSLRPTSWSRCTTCT
jgi:hypothetical protein